ncbi:Actin depolymerizing protein [Venustampulla echinocandica]|uniref:Actin depolymerizing protein n=1 Tax=Venustampulla echinocandica TaxID=2656787 RepID=A0A370TY53_9HELO|nr:Actin depolymerizing protein [Venustampulla echinocandica]RDL40441.1 Actin depolymerizing protein [Venustampulla echinocandica]
MSSSAAEGSEDVSDFLQRIKELGDRRDQEDEERNRKLEEEILQGRKERQARRAERARSISPTKSSPANTPNASKISLALPTGSQSLSPSADPYGLQTEPRRETSIDEAMERLTGTSTSPTNTQGSTALANSERVVESENKRNDSIMASPSSAMPSRNPTLSWQRRPGSQSPDRPRSRPLSIVATEHAARSPTRTSTPDASPVSSAEPVLSRDQIAQSLATKDPAWFRQTADRGLNSPAYRRNQVEDDERANHGSSSARVQMPGMSRESSGTENSSPALGDRVSAARRSTTSESSTSSPYQASSAAAAGIGSPIPLTPAQRLDPPASDSKSETRGLAMSPSQGRISPDRLNRPLSPTKGMGGFVQSAMMKRSDSVSKRWSVQSPPGLNRTNSVASNRSSHDGPNNAASGGTGYPSPIGSRPSSLSRDNSPHPTSRPSSSHSNQTITQERPTTASSMRSSMTTSTDNDGFVKPPLPTSRSEPLQGLGIGKEGEPTEPKARVAMTPPTSPSKTMDTRRWSPTKSSWLESALNKPESPKPKPAPPPQQPSWMSEIAKAKQKSSVDLGRSPTNGPKHEVNIGGLMRSPPPGGFTKPPSIGSLSSAISPGTLPYRRLEKNPSKDGQYTPKQSSSDDASMPITSATISSPVVAKPKPETPPKKDFRSALKSRQLPADNGGTGEPEFKNVFGQLRRTKTQNYVAPDELKNNITRGKAALNITGGPKKTERKDEFKEAILKKKEDFKRVQLEGKGVTRRPSEAGKEAALPEALAKGKSLGKSDSATIAAESTSFSPQTDRTERSKQILPSKENMAPVQAQGKVTGGGKLADRFNPALAGLLARGPPPMASETSRSSTPASQRTLSMSSSITTPDAPGPQLTHVTKGRARGPRRKAPSTLPGTITSEETVSTASAKVNDQVPTSNAPLDSQVTEPFEPSKKNQTMPSSADIESPVSQPPSPRKLDIKRRSHFLQDAPNNITKVEPQLDSPKPLSPKNKANSAEIPVSAQPSRLDSPPKANSPKIPLKSPSLAANIPENTGPDKLQYGQTGRTPQPRRSSKDVISPGNRAADSRSQQEPTVVRSPIKLSACDDETPATVPAGLESTIPLKSKAPIGLGIQTRAPPTARPLPTPPAKTILSPPLSTSLEPSPISPKRGAESLVPQASEAATLISNFFAGKKATPHKFTVDTAGILAARPDQITEIKTLRSSLYQLAGDGKKLPVLSHQERNLFEGNMYLCSHTFEDAAGRKLTEVYHWIGDEVPNSIAEETHLFAQMEAKSCGGNLITVRQGKEPPEFFHALGGIIIIRRGTSNKYDSLAPHILCGRKYFNQIAFDEVDFSASSLCSGFPYLISAPSGKAYLWRGRGSGIEEMSCARLIGMDFGLTGEVEEVEDGNEPASFLDIFNKAEIPKSADHWRMKPNYNKHCNRLFRADGMGKEQIVEISPFSQADLSPSCIYVLDAFFEMYIIVGANAQSQYPAFHNALVFAQEYGILAAGLEDRPFIPVSTVVIEGIPRDMKSVFRKWREGSAPTRTQTAGLQRGRSLRVVPLNAALEATR